MFGTEFFSRWIPQTNKQTSEDYKDYIKRLNNIVQNLPLTTVRGKAECNPGSGYNTVETDCVLETLTLVPILETMVTINQQKITPHPIPLDTSNPTGPWKIVSTTRLPNFYKQMVDEQGKIKEKYYTTSQPLHCFPRPAIMRSRYCTSEHALQPLVDPCLIAILAQNITSAVCEIEETKQTDSLQYLVDHDAVLDVDHHIELSQPHDLVITNDDIVSLMTTCSNNNSETITPLPFAARIHVPAICNLKLLNAPDVLVVQPNAPIPFVKQTDSEKYIKTLHDIFHRGSEIIMNDLQHHFHEHGFIYIIVLSSTVLALRPSILIICLIRKCRRNYLSATESYHVEAPSSYHQRDIVRRSISRPPLTVTYRPSVSFYPTTPFVTYSGQTAIA
jgi:hypothetical protein